MLCQIFAILATNECQSKRDKKLGAPAAHESWAKATCQIPFTLSPQPILSAETHTRQVKESGANMCQFDGITVAVR